MEVPRIISSYRNQGGPEDQCQGDSNNGLPPMPVGRNAVGGSVREKYEGSKAILTGDASCSDTVHGVQGGDGARVAGIPPTYTAWEGNGSETALGNHSPRQVSMYLHTGLPNHLGTAEFPYRGVSGTGSHANDNAGSFISPAYMGYSHHIGGGKPTPPTVSLVRYVGALA